MIRYLGSTGLVLTVGVGCQAADPASQSMARSSGGQAAQGGASTAAAAAGIDGMPGGAVMTAGAGNSSAGSAGSAGTAAGTVGSGGMSQSDGGGSAQGGATADAGTSPGGNTMGGVGMAGTAGDSSAGMGGLDNTGGDTSAGGSGGMVNDPGTEGDGDYTISPPYTTSPDLNAGDAPRGSSYTFTMNSEDSAIFRGDDSTLNMPRSFTREIRVYVPQQYVDGTAAPLMVVQDGYVGDIATALDNLIDDGSVPALVAIFVANGGGDSLGSQRGLEYDTLSDRYSRFITTEVLPAVESHPDILADYPNFALTTDPEGRGAYGCSSGGAAAFTMGWFTPDQFRRIITYSGTFVDQQDTDAPENGEYPLGAWEYHERLIAESDSKPLRVFLHVGENDNGANGSEEDHHNWVMANQRMAAALAAKGYHYRFIFAEDSGHCDASVRRHTLPDTLRWMWRGYP